MGLGKVVGKLTDTVSNLTLGILHSRPVQGVLKGTFRGIGNSVEPMAGAAEKVWKTGDKVLGAAVKKETYQNIGKAVESGVGKVIKNTLTDPDSYKQIGRVPELKIGNLKLNKNVSGAPILASNKALLADDINRRIKTSLNTLTAVSKPLITTGGDNLLPFGMKATGLGVAAAATFQMGAGTPEAVKSWNKSRQGTNYDNQPVTSAPRVPAYAQNGGATGDLVFALNNLRHGGMM